MQPKRLLRKHTSLYADKSKSDQDKPLSNAKGQETDKNLATQQMEHKTLKKPLKSENKTSIIKMGVKKEKL